MNISKKLIYLCATVLTAVLSVGCSQSDNGDDPDEPGFEEGIPTEVTFSLSTRAGNTHTRADGDEEETGTTAFDPNDPGKPKDPNVSVEFIHDWWIALVDRNCNVTVITHDLAEDKTNSITGGSTNNETGFEVENFKAIIPSGTYNIYAFANIPLLGDNGTNYNALSEPEKAKKVAEEFKKKLKNDDDSYSTTLPDKGLEDIIGTGKFTNTDTPANNGMQWPKSQNIPMTGFIEGAKIRNTVEEIFSIEVIRAVAKIQFSFSNPSDDVITLQELQFGQITTSDVWLLPQYNVLDNKVAYMPFGTPSYGFLKFDMKNDEGTNVTLPKNTGTHDFYFYCKESLAPIEDGKIDDVDYKKDSFNIYLKVKKAGNLEEKTFYTKNILRYINRNDWVHIPIIFNEWSIIWHLHFYPPIGGYPPAFEQSNDGKTIEALLTTGGEFEIYPEIKKGDEEYILSLDEWTTNVSMSDPTEIKQTDLDGNPLPAGTSLFVSGKEPEIIANPGNVGGHPLSEDVYPKLIIGELNPKQQGKATMNISFKLPDTDESGTVMDCTFTIIRQNSAPTGN
ncbi:MAG: hypothetical protein K2H22_09815 [Muribaculaceae bacterium]|nr:hypothetical protein [Muribaculaceae bacterium]